MIGLLMVAATANLSAEARYDLTCVDAASWALSWMTGPENKERHDNVQQIVVFYLGRLSGRDNDTDWFSMAVDEMKGTTQSEEYYSDALKGCSQRMLERITPKP
jgi:hypothetical protein